MPRPKDDKQINTKAASQKEAASFIPRSKVEDRLQKIEAEIKEIIDLRRKATDNLRKLEATQTALQGEREGLKRLLGDDDGDEQGNPPEDA